LETQFDYENPPLLRALIVRTNERMHRLYMVFSHVAVDGWSLSILSAELSLLYAEYSAGTEGAARLPSLPLQYMDYASWQRSRLTGRRLAEMTAYCERQFRGLQPLTAADLPFSRGPWNPGLDAGEETFALKPSLTHALRQFSKERRATAFVAMLTAFNVLIYC